MSQSDTPEGHASSLSGAHRIAIVVLASMTLLVIVLDQWSKHWAHDSLAPRMLVGGQGPVHLVGTWVQLVYAENSGAAFSIGTGFTWIFTVIAIIVAIVIIRTAGRLTSVAWAIAMGGLLGGLLGNLCDRMFRPPGPGRGFVIDFIQLPHYPIFNVADSCIVGAAILMVALTLLGVSYRGSSRQP